MIWIPGPKMHPRDMRNPPLPEGYAPYLGHPAYVAREVAAQPSFTLVRSGEAVGVAWNYGPFRFERYVGDVEPAHTMEGPLRLMTWQRVGRCDVPRGWKATRFVMRTSRTGHAIVDDDPAFFTRWSAHAQRHRRRWLQQTDWHIVPIGLDEYFAANKRAKMDAFLRFLFTSLLKQKARSHGALLHIVGAKRGTPHAPTEAGFAFVDVPETRQSIHLMSFHSACARKLSAGVGLMDHWFRHAQSTGIRFLEFGTFWTPGEPNSWKGFTQFKSQFGVTLHDYPLPLARWTGDKKRLLS